MLPDFIRSLCRAIAGIFHHNTGATATMLAIALPGLIGIGALGVETGVWFTIKLQNQSAANSAAISAAYEVIAGKTNVSGELTAAADKAAKRNGYKGSTPVVVYPYSNGSVTNGIAVTLQQSQGALLAAMFLSGVTVASTTVAVIEALDSPCILALGTNSHRCGNGPIRPTRNAQLFGCREFDRKTAIELLGSSSSISAATLVTAGEVSLNGIPIDPAALPPQFALSSPALIGAPNVADPYTGILTHSLLTTKMPKTGQCKSSMVGGVSGLRGQLRHTRLIVDSNGNKAGGQHAYIRRMEHPDGADD